MLKETITYKDYNGVDRTETFYFNLTESEITEMEMSTTGGLSEMIQRLIETQDMPAIIKIFKDLVLMSYGEKSADGKRFMKVDEKGNKLSVAFSQTEAYNKLFMSLATDADKAAAFFNEIIPKPASK